MARQRNRVKNGTGFGTFHLEGDIGIQFTRLTDENVLVVDVSANRVGLSEVARALTETCRLMALVRELAALGDDVDGKARPLVESGHDLSTRPNCESH